MGDCEEVGFWTAFAGWWLVLGTIITFSPQFAKILWNKDATGVSLEALWLGTMSALTSSICAALIEWKTFHCCFGVGFMECNNSLLSFYQILSRFLVYLPLYTIALHYHPSNPNNSHLRQQNEQKELNLNRLGAGDSGYESELGINILEKETPSPSFDWKKLNCIQVCGFKYWDMLVVMIAVCLLSTALTAFLIVSDQYYGTNLTTIFGDIYGYLSAVVTCFIWLPQIISLYVHKEQGSLSLLMFALQAPGGLLITYFQGVLEGEPVSVWVGPLVAAIQQFVICFQIIYYKIKNRNKTSFETVEDKERLLGN